MFFFYNQSLLCIYETTCEWKVCEPQQTFVDVTESTSNVNYVRNAVQKRWGEEYTLVTVDGLEIEDSSGTQGRYSDYLPYELFLE